MEIAIVTKETCNFWEEYALNNDIYQIDSGLRHERYTLSVAKSCRLGRI